MTNKKTIILLDDEDKLMHKVFTYSFKHADVRTVPSSYSPFDRDELAKEINNNYQQVLFFGYFNQLYLILPLISKTIIKKWIIDHGIAKLSEDNELSNLLQIFEYKERGLIDYIGTTKYDLYITFSDKMNFLQLDYKREKIEEKNTNKSIGILNQYYEFSSNFYNQISGVALSDIKNVKVLNYNNITKQFAIDFNIELFREQNIEKLIEGNMVNLNCKFCDISPIPFLISMDLEIPCILGNTNILDDSQELRNYLVLESDDDVNEIKEKIERAITSKKEIMNLYLKWRKDYSKKSKQTIESFMKLGGE